MTTEPGKEPGILTKRKPKYSKLPVRLLLGFMWCLTRLPYSWQIAAGHVIGIILYRFAVYRKHIARVNLSLCFPDLSEQAREQLLKKNIISTGIGFVETAMSWWLPDSRLEKLSSIEGLDNLHDALDRGKGVILLSAHFTTLEIGGRLLARHVPFHVMYREHKNPVIESVMKKARLRNFDKAIPRNDLRSLIKSLKQNMPVWYAPDQDYGIEKSIFAPFFGVDTASITATSRLADMSGAAVVPFFQTRLPGTEGYQLTLYPALQNFPGETIEEDTRRVNKLIEARIRENPEQYLWVHRRFKTRPEEMPDVYS